MTNLQISVIDILRSEGLSKKVQLKDIELDPLEFRDEILSLDRVELDLDLTNTGLGVIVKGKVKASLNADCSRCLDSFKHSINIYIDDIFLKEKVEGGLEEKQLIVDDKIDIGPLIDQSIILNIPIKLLCKADCMGLCPKCGKNLNKELCMCKEAPIDVRWDKLKDWKS